MLTGKGFPPLSLDSHFILPPSRLLGNIPARPRCAKIVRKGGYSDRGGKYTCQEFETPLHALPISYFKENVIVSCMKFVLAPASYIATL